MGILPNSGLLSQVTRREEYRNAQAISETWSEANVFKFTGSFTYKEKNLQPVHLILSSEVDIFGKKFRFISLTVVILKARQLIVFTVLRGNCLKLI